MNDIIEYKGGDFRESLVKNEELYPLFKRFKINTNKIKDSFYKNTIISIQASYGHYSIPRENINKYKYSHFEVAIIINNNFITIDNFKEWLPVGLCSLFKKYKSGSIYAFVPVEIIQILIESIC